MKNIFNLLIFTLLVTAFACESNTGSATETEEMRANYLGGNYGYGQAKQSLYEVIIDKYSKERVEYARLMENLGDLEKLLESGEKKAEEVSSAVLAKVKDKIKF